MHPSPAAADDAVDPIHFRHVVGHLATGVTVVTSTDGGVRFGMTASSVTSLSVDPPMMLACLNNSTPTAAAVARSGRYIVNILGEHQGDLAQQFSMASHDKFRDVAVRTGSLGVPMLTEALARIECEVSEHVVGGTHTIFLGRVTSAEVGQGQPLTYFRGGFGRLEFGRDDEVYQKARQQVLQRVFVADEVIVLEDLAAQLGVDRSAAFYALTKLSTDGLVTRDPDRGYVIAPFDVRTSDDTFDARLAIELGVIDLCMGNMSEHELIKLRHRYELMAAQLVNDQFVDFQDYLDANYAFHEHIVSLAHNPLLDTMFANLSIKRVMTRSFGSTAKSSQKFIELQRQLTESFERSDAAAAHQAATDYCAQAKARVREILANTGGSL